VKEGGFVDDLRVLWRRLVVAFTASGGLSAPPQSSAPYAYFFFQVATTEYNNFVTDPIGTINRLVTNPTVRQDITNAVNQGAGGYQGIRDKVAAESQANGYPVWICIWIVR
jgi:hypothetical protein